MSGANELAERGLHSLHERSPGTSALLQTAAPEFRDSVRRVFAASDFVIDSLARDEQLLPQLLAGPARLELPLPLPLSPDEAGFMTVLRRWRRAELTRIAWRGPGRWATLPGKLLEFSKAGGGRL